MSSRSAPSRSMLSLQELQGVAGGGGWQEHGADVGLICALPMRLTIQPHAGRAHPMSRIGHSRITVSRRAGSCGGPARSATHNLPAHPSSSSATLLGCSFSSRLKSAQSTGTRGGMLQSLKADASCAATADTNLHWAKQALLHRQPGQPSPLKAKVTNMLRMGAATRCHTCAQRWARGAC